jgi:hypothetical protein
MKNDIWALTPIKEADKSMLEQTVFMERLPSEEDEFPRSPAKAIVLINCSIFCLSLTFLASKFLYESHSDMEASQLLFMRGIISSTFSILWVNTKLKMVVWDSIPRSQFKNLAIRSGQACLLILIQFTIVKYLSLIYIGVA